MAAIFGGVWAGVAVFSVTAMVAGLDHFVAKVTAPLPDTSEISANRLSAVLAIAHLCLLPLVVWALSGTDLSTLEKLCIFVASGIFFGQISNANAHELIHRQGRGLFRLGMWTYISLLFGHHVSAHLLIHHRHVGTERDPNTSRLGESYYRYVARSWVGSFRAGYAAEVTRLKRVQRHWFENPFLVYIAGASLFLVGAFALGGWGGVAWFVGLAVFAQQQLLLCDYVQHYGLKRQPTADGRLEPIKDCHSWNAPHWYSAGMMLNAPRHSDHHAHPYRPYPVLALPADGPTLPRSLPVMAVLALFPPAWRRVMDRRAMRWQAP